MGWRLTLRPYFLIVPALLLTCGILYPFGLGLYYTLFDFSASKPQPDMVRLHNYETVFTQDAFWNSAWVTVLYAVGAAAVETVLGVAVALLLHRSSIVGRVLEKILILPLMIAPVIAAIMWKLMLQPSVGVVNHLLKPFGLGGVQWTDTPTGALLSSIAVDVWVYTPFVAILALAGLRSLPTSLLSFRFAPELTVIIPLFVLYQKLGLFDTYVGMIWVLQLVTLPLIVWIMRSYFADLTPELEQAALLDGYTRKQAFFKVALPLVKPGIAAVSLLAFIFAWNNFVFPLILTSNEAQTVTVGALSFLGGDRPRYNLTAAAALVSVVPPLLLALTIQRYLVRGLSFGAVKS